MTNSETWDRARLHSEFLSKANNAHDYLDEVRGKIKRNRSYEGIHDMTLAEFYVYNTLHGKLFLEDRNALLGALTDLLATDPPRDQVFDQERYSHHFAAILRGLISRFQAYPTTSQ